MSDIRGPFLVYVSCAAHIRKTTVKGKVIGDDSDFVMYLLEDFNVTTTQGAAHGLSLAFLISFTKSTEVIEKNRQRILKASEQLQ